MIIYKIINLINGKFYVGKTTKTIEKRFQRHFYNHKTGNTYLYKSMRKYGFDNFRIEIIEETAHLNEREKYWIDILSPDYNMTKGGDGGDTSNSPNYINAMKIRDISGTNNPMYGKKRTDSANYLKLAEKKRLESNKCPVSCEGKKYESIDEAQKAYPGISVRKRLDNKKYPNFFRLKQKIPKKKKYPLRQYNILQHHS